ncbi:MAG TPA: cytochrome d ubiquinol oxidase subunit II, partial [Psychromonas sp.]
HYQGGFFDLLNPFALLVGLFSLSLFVLQGSTWLQMKTDGIVQQRARWVSLICAPISIVLFALAGLWVAYGIDGYVITSIGDLSGPANPLLKSAQLQSGAWLANYDKYPLTMIAPVVGLSFPALVWIASKLDRNAFAFFFSSVTQVGVLMTFALSMFPFIMPSSIDPNFSLTVWDAVSSEKTLNIMSIAAAIFIPIILLYTSWCYFKMFGRIGKEFMAKYKHSAY